MSLGPPATWIAPFAVLSALWADAGGVKDHSNPVVLPPAVVGLLGHPDRALRLNRRLPQGQRYHDLGQPSHDCLRLVMLPRRLRPP